MRIGTVEVTTNFEGDFTAVQFTRPFPDGSEVIVIATSQTRNNNDFTISRIRSVTESGFEITFDEDTFQETVCNHFPSFSDLVEEGLNYFELFLELPETS